MDTTFQPKLQNKRFSKRLVVSPWKYLPKLLSQVLLLMLSPMELHVVRFLTVVCCIIVLTEAAPRRNFSFPQSQACGDKLADMLSLICSGRGYNFAFKPEGGSARRFRRGIVEECCRKSCTPAMLELYCRADPADETSNVQIRKRSDSGMDSREQNSELIKSRQSLLEVETKNKNSEDNKITEKNEFPTLSQRGEEKMYKPIDLLVSSEYSIPRHSPKHIIDKSIPNDTTEEFVGHRISNPLIRHHKNKDHHNRRQSRNRKASKTKRDKSRHEENRKTFEIGTVKPYFAGRPLVSYRSYSLS